MADLFAAVGHKLYPLKDLRPKAYCSLECIEKKEVEIEERKKECILRNVTQDISKSTCVSTRKFPLLAGCAV